MGYSVLHTAAHWQFVDSKSESSASCLLERFPEEGVVGHCTEVFQVLALVRAQHVQKSLELLLWRTLILEQRFALGLLQELGMRKFAVKNRADFQMPFRMVIQADLGTSWQH